MSKLEGNERWKTKMIMTEHVEQYEEQQRENPDKMITMEERTMVRDLILLPYIDTMVSKSLKEIEPSSNILKRAYLMAGQAIQRRIMQDTYRLQKELKQRNIRVLADEQEEFLVYYKIFCRGYQERFGLTRDVMRTEISLRLTKYTAELGAILKDHLK
ncbi:MULTISPECIES: hypothetical protein [Paenibacillus]|uniref:Uncharacterized protein n=1 Tax=Paenibacillus odorifer TaxID=189426 RepID=A0A1R0ZGX0_9BACL|nr:MULTISPECIES: hypothetical protein [Paenibacillus]MBY3624161.1 hypothetical protein [Acinetobacter sp. CUI P1]AIQ25423.1 hypothetical protein H70737_22670 [Paenibacillus sp. FSL H7-0737]KAA1181389.1 hypothetical protein PAENI_21655 [Paenibacillus sp. B2(2019)]OMD46740.1 hypothetical protein BSK51_26165 [Paenibacillus odorifer]OME69834.1 hypothetical protein BSK65_12940 [Paenibacillus odorifer]